MDFSMETITSAPAINSTHVDLRPECREESIAEVLQSEDSVLINDSDNEIPDTVTKVTSSETLDILHAHCTEIHGDKQMNVMLIELIGKMKTLKLQNYPRIFLKIKSFCL